MASSAPQAHGPPAPVSTVTVHGLEKKTFQILKAGILRKVRNLQEKTARHTKQRRCGYPLIFCKGRLGGEMNSAQV